MGRWGCRGGGHVGGEGMKQREGVGGRKAAGHGRNARGPRWAGTGERTVKRMKLSKALTIPEGTSVLDACRRMSTRRVDAALLTDSSALLCGIVTDKDVSTRVIAQGLKPDQTPVSQVMTRNPVFVLADALAVDALHKMVQGNFRHLPVVENGEVIALLDITKCLYDAIARMEEAAEKGSAIAAAVEGVDRQWGNTYCAPHSFIETLQERMFRPSLSTIVVENTKLATVSPLDPVYLATKKMSELQVNSVVVTAGNKPQGILTSKDVLMRVAAQNLSPELTPVEKVMTPNPECVAVDMTIVDALHIMHDGKILHLPVVNKDGFIAACVDVLQIAHAAMAMVGGAGGGGNDMANTMMQKFWDSASALEPLIDDDDSHSDVSTRLPAENSESGKMGYPTLDLGNTFAFKLLDHKGHVYRFYCGTESLTELISVVIKRIGDDSGRSHPPNILYEDDEGDKVLLATDSDLITAVNHARLAGWKLLRLHIDDSNSADKEVIPLMACTRLDLVQKSYRTSAYVVAAAGAVLLAGVCTMVYLKRSSS